MNFFPIKTNDDTWSLYNSEVNDVYHSRAGAYTESLHKYTVPCGLIEFAKNNQSINILDVCYGLGYNSKTAINEILKINPDIEINLTALEIDPVVLAFSNIIGCECYAEVVNNLIFEEINKLIKVEEVIKNYLKEAGELLPQFKKLIPAEYQIVKIDEINSRLEKIYYKPHKLQAYTSDYLKQKYYLIDDFQYVEYCRKKRRVIYSGVSNF